MFKRAKYRGFVIQDGNIKTNYGEFQRFELIILNILNHRTTLLTSVSLTVFKGPNGEHNKWDTL